MPRIYGFNVKSCGFHFNNAFVNHVGPITTKGLCGGMSLAVFNYFRHNLPIPAHTEKNFGSGNDVPPEPSKLRDYIFSQQMASFVSAAGFIFIQWPFESDEHYSHRHFDTSLDAFYQVRNAINHNKFVLLGLRSREYGNLIGHQVLAFGYDNSHGSDNTQESYDRIYIYDPNHHDEERVILLDQGNSRILFDKSDNNRSINDADRDYWSCFTQLELDHMHPDLLTEANRPKYLDLTLTKPIEIKINRQHTTTPISARIGETIEFEATVQNKGDYDVDLKAILLWARDPEGNNKDYALGSRTPVSQIKPGEVVKVTHTIKFTNNNLLGLYRFGVSYKSEQDEWLNIPYGRYGGHHEAHISLLHTFKNQIGASVIWPNGKAYFFKDSEYKRFDLNSDQVDNGYPRKIKGHWGGIPDTFTKDIDAVLLWHDDKKAYFFKGDQYIRYDVENDTMDSGYPKTIADKWGNWPEEFSSVDAAFLVKEKEVAYFFKDDKYLRYNVKKDKVDPGYPRKITDYWIDWPHSFANGVDSACIKNDKNKVYFFKGDSYLRYDLVKDKVDNGYPLSIRQGWKGL